MQIWNIARLTIHEGVRRNLVRLSLGLGLLFLIVFGVGMHYIFLQFEDADFMSASEMQMPAIGLTIVGLYVINFLVILISVLISVAAISSEIDTHVIDTIVTKPVRRWEIVLGKWLGFVIMISVYTLVMAGGLIIISIMRTGVELENIAGGLILMCLNGVLVMTISIAGGTRLSTLANGVVAFMLYGIAFIGTWVENIGAVFENEAAVNIGIISSLVVPAEAVWRKASLLFQPRILGNPQFAGPVTVFSEPSDMMIWYSIFYVAILLSWSLWSFSNRDL
ncbi:MAG: Cu-processing system permease protein [Cellvibrionaceae bacterium]|jgi:Cu-processing system permease protein